MFSIFKIRIRGIILEKKPFIIISNSINIDIKKIFVENCSLVKNFVVLQRIMFANLKEFTMKNSFSRQFFLGETIRNANFQNFSFENSFAGIRISNYVSEKFQTKLTIQDFTMQNLILSIEESFFKIENYGEIFIENFIFQVISHFLRI